MNDAIQPAPAPEPEAAPELPDPLDLAEAMLRFEQHYQEPDCYDERFVQRAALVDIAKSVRSGRTASTARAGAGGSGDEAVVGSAERPFP